MSNDSIDVEQLAATSEIVGSNEYLETGCRLGKTISRDTMSRCEDVTPTKDGPATDEGTKAYQTNGPWPRVWPGFNATDDKAMITRTVFDAAVGCVRDERD